MSNRTCHGVLGCLQITITLPTPGKMGAFRIGNAKTTTIFTPALDVTNVVTEKIAPTSPLDFATISILPVEIGIAPSDVTTPGPSDWKNFSGFGGGFQVAKAAIPVSEVSAP